MKKLNAFLRWMGVIFLIGFFLPIQSQTEKELLAQIIEEDQAAINALVLYPEDTRYSILEATLYPEALIKLENIQSQTGTSFRELLEGYPKSTQEIIWDLTRYPNLIHQLVLAGEGSRTGINAVLKDYPEVIHPRAKDAALNHFRILDKVDKLNHAAESAFASLLMQYPTKTQKALNELIKLPEVLTLLTENIRLTILVGDLYKNEPEFVLHHADSLHLEVARQNAEELEDWKESLENNPQAMEELKSSAESFAKDNGYDDEYYEFDGDDLYYDAEEDYYEPQEEQYYEREVREVVHHHYYDYHYPYWFGYPHWYYYPRWRVYPYWYDWGFYFGSHRSVVVIGFPSYYFNHWFFYHPHHFYYYPNLSANYTNYYYGHRTSINSVTTTVSNWRSSNQAVITDRWMEDDGNLTTRFQEFGKFETDRLRYNRDRPTKALSQTEYIERYKKRYPDLAKSAERIKSGKTNYEEPVYKPRTKAPVREPDVRIPTVPKTNKVSPKTKRTTVPRVKKGTEYHKNTWEKSKTLKARGIKPSTQKRVIPRTKIRKFSSSKMTIPKTRTKIKTTRKNN
jgi:hypothetical protein